MLLAVAAGVSCGDPEPPPRVLLIGVDGLEWSVITPLIEAGELPHLRSLLDRGTCGTIATIDPTLSPVVWTTIATGKLPDKHGIHHFFVSDAEDDRIRLYNSTDRRVRALWNVLSEHERRVHVVGWFVTYPAEPIRGMMVSQYATAERWKGTLQEGVPHQTYPESLLEELSSEIRAVNGENDALAERIFGTPRPEELGRLEADLVRNTRWALEADALYGRIATRILRSDPDFDLLAVYFGGPDVVGHRFWRYYRPGRFRHPPSPEKRRLFADVIENYYRWIDEWIGRLLEADGGRSITIVVSDHGMAETNLEIPFDRLESIDKVNSAHHLDVKQVPGVIVAAGPRIRRDCPLVAEPPAPLQTLGSVTGIAPTVLYLLDLPVALDMDGSVIDVLIDDRHLGRHPVRTVETFESAPRAMPEPAQAAELEEEMLERFRALGYID